MAGIAGAPAEGHYVVERGGDKHELAEGLAVFRRA
jgi:hypothetical protein